MIEHIPTKRKIITLCGSTKFKDQYDQINALLTIGGNIILSCGFFLHSVKPNLSASEIEQIKTEADALHKDKIFISDEIFAIDMLGYIGDSTRSEIEYAMSINKPVRFYSREYQNCENGNQMFSSWAVIDQHNERCASIGRMKPEQTHLLSKRDDLPHYSDRGDGKSFQPDYAKIDDDMAHNLKGERFDKEKK